MDLASLEALLGSEKRARQFFVAKCWGKGRRFCIRCNSRKLYRLAEKRYRCARCRYTFQDFTGRWIGQLNLKGRDWLRILKLFELEVATPLVAREARISYPTALKAALLIRCAMAQQSDDFARFGERIALGEAVFGRRRTGARPHAPTASPPVFGIVRIRGRVRVTGVDLNAERMLREGVKTVKAGAVAYTERLGSYDTVVFYGTRHLNARFARRFARGQMYIDGANGFWNFAKKRLAALHAVSRQSFPLYLKEMEFRYNRRHEELFDALAHAVAQLVPNFLVPHKKSP